MSKGVIWASEYSLGPQIWGPGGPRGPPWIRYCIHIATILPCVLSLCKSVGIKDYCNNLIKCHRFMCTGKRSNQFRNNLSCSTVPDDLNVGNCTNSHLPSLVRRKNITITENAMEHKESIPLIVRI